MGPIVISITSTKGGVGKTTLAANLGALLAQFGMKTLLIDADVQPSLSRYFPITQRATNGLQAVITRGGVIQPDSISRTNRPGLDLVVSDAPDGTLQAWLKDREDRLLILKRAVHSTWVRDNYDTVVIDTQGAVGELQRTAAMAADMMISPVNPTMISAREFASGTMAMLSNLNSMADFSKEFQSGDLYALIYMMDRTADARAMAERIRTDFRATRGVRVMDVMVPVAAAYKTGATSQIPAYEVCDVTGKVSSAHDTLHQIVWELFPNLKGIHYDDITDEDDGSSPQGGEVQ